MTTPVKFGWHMPSFPIDGSNGSHFVEQIHGTLGRIQDLFDSAWADDHFVPWADWQALETPYLECVTTMAYLAGVYPRLKFGATVLCQSYRNPALLAKTMANLQLLCGGRLLFGIGAGWLEREYAAYGYEFPEPAVRIAQLDETVEIVKRMWTQPRATFHGKHYRIEEAICEPKPDPIPPILIGGGGEKLTLRVVAKHADWWNFPGGTRENYARKLEVLRRHCDAVGTDYAAIRKTWSPDGIAVARTEAEARRIGEASPYASNPVVGTPDQVAEQLRAWVEIGVTYFIVRLLDFPRSEGIELFAHEVMPRLARA